MSNSINQQMLDRYIEAEIAVLEGKTVTINGRTFTMENLSEIREGRKEWQRRVDNHKSKRGPYKLARFL